MSLASLPDFKRELHSCVRDDVYFELYPSEAAQLLLAVELLESRHFYTRVEPRGLCPKGCGALIYLGHPHMCSAERDA